MGVSMAGMAGMAGSVGGYGTLIQSGGQLLSGLSESKASRESAKNYAYQGELARGNAALDAASITEAAMSHASKLRRLTAREVSSSRASTAAGGVALDEFNLINTEAIDKAGEEDVTTSILQGGRQAAAALRSGEQSGRAMDQSAKQSVRKGRDAFMSSVIGAGTNLYGGWRGANKPTTPTTGDFARMDRGQK